MARFEGVYVASVTPFTDSYEVDYIRLREHVDFLIENSVNGIIPTGSLGEYAVLSKEERVKVIETTIEAANGRVDVMVGCAAPSTKQVLELVELAKEKGAAGVMALPPVNYKPNEAEVIAHYEAISRVGLPVIVYNNPLDYPVDLKPSILKKLSQFENIVGVKEFSGDVRRIPDILRETDLEVMVGVDDLALEGAVVGATGWIAGFPNVFPKECSEIFALAREGKAKEALEIYRYFLPLFHHDADPRLVQAIKYAMELKGIPAGPTRLPRLPLSSQEKEQVKQDFDYALKRNEYVANRN